MKTAKPATRKELTEQTFHLISAIQNMSNAIIDLNQRVEKLEADKENPHKLMPRVVEQFPDGTQTVIGSNVS